MNENTAKEILEFWFGKMENNTLPEKEKQQMWWVKDQKLDNLIRKKFEKHLILAKFLEFQDLEGNKEKILAAVILLDQFSRNIYRNTPEAFAQDNTALNIVLKGIERGIDKKMKAVEKSFFYMPLMHSEDISVQEKSLKYYSAFKAEYKDSDDFANLTSQQNKYAVLHYDIIKKFGRYPHRNRILNRESTTEEMEFLKGPGSSF